MKKDLLFVMPSMDAGGGEKSLANLLRTIDYNRFNVDLLLFHKQGFFLQLLPGEVNVIEPGGDYRLFSGGLFQSVVAFLGRLKFAQAFARVAFFAINRNPSNKSEAEQRSWKYRSMSLPELTKKYHSAIAFLEKSSVYYVVEKVRADKKIGWIHTNYANSGMKREFDLPYFTELDRLVAVSDECALGLASIFPEVKNKISTINNIVSETMVRSLAIAENPAELKDGNIIVSVGRLSREKGFDLAVEAASELRKRGVSFQWIVIGDGAERQSLGEKIGELKLDGYFSLIGLRANPYAYVSRATVYVQPSRYEGKSIAIDEAKILAVPIVVTNFETVNEQIADGETGIVTGMDGKSIADGIERLLTDEPLRRRISENLSKQNLSSESEISKLYDII